MITNFVEDLLLACGLALNDLLKPQPTPPTFPSCNPRSSSPNPSLTAPPPFQSNDFPPLLSHALTSSSPASTPTEAVLFPSFSILSHPTVCQSEKNAPRTLDWVN
ncbi:hypothetical protein AAC387_Pa03g1151 [Persea americana]